MSVRIITIFVFFIFQTLYAGQEGKTPQVIPFLKNQTKPKEVWENAVCFTDFKDATTGKILPREEQTIARIGYNTEGLHAYVICNEPNKINAKQQDREALWAEDSIEIFIQPAGSAYYYQFVVNAIGSRFAAIRMEGILGSIANNRIYEWSAKASSGSGRWSVWVNIPWQVLINVPAPDAVWLLNVCRNRGTIHSSWANVRGSFHDLRRLKRCTFSNNISAGIKFEKSKKKIARLLKKEAKNLDIDSVYMLLSNSNIKLTDEELREALLPTYKRDLENLLCNLTFVQEVCNQTKEYRQKTSDYTFNEKIDKFNKDCKSFNTKIENLNDIQKAKELKTELTEYMGNTKALFQEILFCL